MYFCAEKSELYVIMVINHCTPVTRYIVMAAYLHSNVKNIGLLEAVLSLPQETIFLSHYIALLWQQHHYSMSTRHAIMVSSP